MADMLQAGERTTGGTNVVFFWCVQGEKRVQDDLLPDERIWSLEDLELVNMLCSRCKNPQSGLPIPEPPRLLHTPPPPLVKALASRRSRHPTPFPLLLLRRFDFLISPKQSRPTT